MNSKTAGLLRFRRIISIGLGISFVLYLLFIINFKVFINTPAIGFNHVFIGNAKPYYFEESSVSEKALEFTSFYCKDLWLSLPNVSNVVTSDELPGAESKDTPHICSATINKQVMDMGRKDKTVSQLRLFDETLNQVSAAAWEVRVDTLICDLIELAFLAALLVAWIIYLRGVQKGENQP